MVHRLALLIGGLGALGVLALAVVIGIPAVAGAADASATDIGVEQLVDDASEQSAGRKVVTVVDTVYVESSAAGRRRAARSADRQPDASPSPSPTPTASPFDDGDRHDDDRRDGRDRHGDDRRDDDRRDARDRHDRHGDDDDRSGRRHDGDDDGHRHGGDDDDRSGHRDGDHDRYDRDDD